MKVCPFCKSTFDGSAGGQVSAGDELADHYTEEHQNLFESAEVSDHA